MSSDHSYKAKVLDKINSRLFEIHETLRKIELNTRPTPKKRGYSVALKPNGTNPMTTNNEHPPLSAEAERDAAIKELGEVSRKLGKLEAERDALKAKLDAIDVTEYSRLIGENERLKRQLQWQPIETMPKGKRVLLFSENRKVYAGEWVIDPVTGDEQISIGTLNRRGEKGILIGKATHWMPLPQPPQEGE